MLTLLATTAGVPTYAADAASDDAKAVTKIEHEWNDAVKTKNKAFFEKYLSDDFTYINENGEFFSGPAAYIDIILKMPKVVEVTATDEKIRVQGTTAVATGRFGYKDSDGGTYATRYTDVYAKGPDGWKSIASQESNTKK